MLFTAEERQKLEEIRGLEKEIKQMLGTNHREVVEEAIKAFNRLLDENTTTVERVAVMLGVASELADEGNVGNICAMLQCVNATKNILGDDFKEFSGRLLKSNEKNLDALDTVLNDTDGEEGQGKCCLDELDETKDGEPDIDEDDEVETETKVDLSDSLCLEDIPLEDVLKEQPESVREYIKTHSEDMGEYKGRFSKNILAFENSMLAFGDKKSEVDKQIKEMLTTVGDILDMERRN